MPSTRDMLLLLLPLALLAVVSCLLLRRASPIKAMHTRLAALKWAFVQDFSTVMRRAVLVTDRVTAHRLLVRGGAGGAFCNRPLSSTTPTFIMSRQRHHNIGSATYGPLWRAIRRNLVSGVLHPSRLRRYGPARRRALSCLIADLRGQCTSNGVARAAESMHAAMFGLVATMCFGDDIDAGRVRAMADSAVEITQLFGGVRVFAAVPALTELIHRKRWNKMVALRRKQEEMYLPLIDVRRDRNRRSGEPLAYVDTLIDLRVPDDNTTIFGGSAPAKRPLRDGELVGLCSEFLGASTGPAAAALQWVMANLVKQPDVQEAVRREINAVVDADAEDVGEEVLPRLEYLNAVLMEALRLHPPFSSVTRLVMPEDHIVLDDRRVPAGTTVQFLFESLARDKTVWTDPDVFKPERFLGLAGGRGDGAASLVEAAGSAGEMMMMPFGAGRRICPGVGVAVLHLGYFVVNLVREFEWTESSEGDLAVGLEPLVGFLSVMKRPLRAQLVMLRAGGSMKCHN